MVRGSLLFVAALVLSGAPSTDYKIDPALMSRLAEDVNATAPLFVVFGERAPVKQAYGIADIAARRAFVVQVLQAAANRSQAAARALLQAQRVRFTPFWIENKIFLPECTLALARELAKRPEVVAILPDVIYSIPPYRVAPDSGTQGIEWNIVRIRADQVWPSATGTGIVIASIDTGVQYDHPALVNQYRGKAGSAFSHAGNWSDPTGVCGSTPCDNIGHGTHTMGTMVGSDGATNQIGAAPGAKWISCKGCADNNCGGSALIACAQWVMSPDGSAPADIVNNSWGGSGGSSWYQSYVQNWRAAGIFPAFSAGNTGPSCGTAGSPGDYTESFASGASDSADVIASFSGRGPSIFAGIKPNITAPGVNIRSSYVSGSYAMMSGTSMASPHTAGAVALLWAAAPTYRGNVSATEQALQQTAAVLTTTESCGGISAGAHPNNTYGWGRLDVLAAAGGGAPVNQPPVVQITAPANGSSYTCPVAVTFTATATDPENNLGGPIQWSDNGAAIGAGTSVSRTYACTAAGNHNIVASVTDAGGASDTETITISIVNTSIPSAPTGLTATVSGGTVALKWTAASTNEDGFRIERKKQKGSGWKAIASTGRGVTAYTDSPGRGTFDYRVSAFNQAGTSAPSNLASATVN